MPLTDQSEMPFGKHKGEKLQDVPADYLLFIWDKFVHEQPDKPLYGYIKENFYALETEADDYIVQHHP